MSPHELNDEIQKFLSTETAKRICRRYRADPNEAQGELYSKLINRQPSRTVRNFAAWWHVTSVGLLKNYLRREHLTLV